MATRRLLSEIVADKIKKMIIEGEIETGSQLPSEQELAERLNVSVRSVREAEKALVSCNILEIRRGIGTFATETPGFVDDPLGFEFMETDELYPDLVEIRLIMEPEVFVLAAYRGSDAEFAAAKRVLDQISQVNQQIKEASGSDEALLEQISALDMQFHCCIYQASHNQIAQRLLPLILKTIRKLYDSEKFKDFRRSSTFYSRHQAMYDAVLNKDVIQIRELCRAHISSGRIEGGLLY